MIDFDDDDDGDREDECATETSGGGYGRPPVAHQFKPGNPGRPKGSRNKPKTIADELLRALEKEVAAQGKDSVTARQYIATKAVREAMTEDAKITQRFVQMIDVIEARQQRRAKERPITLAEALFGEADES